MANTAIVTYFHNSGLSVAIEDTLLIFDYWCGENGAALPPAARITDAELKSYARVLVFVSHEHEDHFDEIIYRWDYEHLPITYIVSDDLPIGKRGKRMKPGDTMTVDGVEIAAFDSTDKGVSFYVTVDGLHIFHAGDLNLWHWREESTPREIARAEADFYAAVDPLTRVPIDIAMFPVDPRMGGLYDAGANHFVMAVKPSVFIPIHWQGRPEVAVSYARTGHTAFTEVVALTKLREAAVVVFGEFDFQVRKLPVPDFPASGEPDEKPGVREGGDPFTGTDLPVNDLG